MPGIGTSKATNTATTTLDASTQAALDNYRKTSQAQYGSFQKLPLPNLEGVESFFNPYQEEVIGAARGDFAHQRKLAEMAAADEATKAGAFGGDRAAVLSGVLQSGVNRDESSTIAGLRSGGWRDAVAQLFAARGQRSAEQDAALGRMGYSLGFGGRTVSGASTETPSVLDRYFQFLNAGANAAGAMK